MADILVPTGRGLLTPSIAPDIASPTFGVAGLQLTPQSPATLLGSALKAEWDARAGVAANTWTDSVASTVLTGTGSPTFGADAGYFNELSVWQFSGAQYLDTGNLAELVPVDVDAWFCVIGRLTIVDATTRQLFSFRNDQSPNDVAYAVRANSTTNLWNVTWGAAAHITQRTADTAMHRFEILALNGRRYFYVDGQTYLAATGASSGRSVERVALPTVSSSTSACSIAVVRIAWPVPTGIQRQQMRAYDRAIWGTP